MKIWAIILTLGLISAATLRATSRVQSLEQTEPSLKELIDKIKLIATQTASESLTDTTQSYNGDAVSSDSTEKAPSLIGLQNFEYTFEDEFDLDEDN